MGCEDAELIRRWQAGDETAFAALVRRWQQPVGRFLCRFVGDADRAQDLCQEVFLRVYQAGRRYRPTGAFSSWLYRIAVNVARDAARRRRWAPQPLAETAAPVEDPCQRREVVQLVARTVAELPE